MALLDQSLEKSSRMEIEAPSPLKTSDSVSAPSTKILTEVSTLPGTSKKISFNSDLLVLSPLVMILLHSTGSRTTTINFWDSILKPTESDTWKQIMMIEIKTF